MTPADDRAGSGAAGLHPYVEFTFAADPIAASAAGYRALDDELGDISPPALAQVAADRRELLTRTENLAAGSGHSEGTAAWFEQELLLTAVRHDVLLEERQRPFQRAPYLYPERVGEALSALLRPQPDEQDRVADAERLLSRLRQVPVHLTDALANLSSDIPQLWADMGVQAAQGLSAFVDGAVRGFAEDGLPAGLAADLDEAVNDAGTAVDGYTDAVAPLAADASGSWVAGRDYVDTLLRDYQHVDLDIRTLAELGTAAVASARQELEEFAAAVDLDRSWQQQVSALKDRHPAPADLLQTYSTAVDAARQHTATGRLLSIPEAEDCHLDWVPEYQRSSLPMGVMNPVAPYADTLTSQFLITPVDPLAAADRAEEHLRDSNFVFISSIAGHETYPGHHLQSVHHRLGTARGSMARFVRSPQFVEGWGLYVEDLQDETGFMSDDVRLFKRRNTLWRALRVVVDSGLHSGALSFSDAVTLMCTEAGMDRHMATGEVRRYTRHDNPTYPSSYLLGRNLLHDLRGRWMSEHGNGQELRDFHDRLLSFGSPPVALLAPMLAAPARPPAGSRRHPSGRRPVPDGE